MKAINEKWCEYHGQMIDNAAQRLDHQMSACNVVKVKTPIVSASRGKHQCCGQHVRTKQDRAHHESVHHTEKKS